MKPRNTNVFAPGVIEHHRTRWLGTAAQRRELVRLTHRLLACGAAAVAICLLAVIYIGSR